VKKAPSQFCSRFPLGLGWVTVYTLTLCAFHAARARFWPLRECILCNPTQPGYTATIAREFDVAVTT